MNLLRHSPRFRTGFSAIFFVAGVVFTVWELGIYWTRAIIAIRNFKNRRF